MEAFLTASIEHFSHAAVFLLLLACGFGAPFSEEVIVVLGGVVAGEAGHNLWWMVATAYLGEMAGDLALFFIGRKLGVKALQANRFRRVLAPRHVHWAKNKIQKHGGWAIAVIRFLPGIRAPAILLSGAGDLPTRTFLFADGLAALITAPVLTWIGYRFGDGVLRDFKLASHVVPLAALGLIIVIAVVTVIRNRRKPPEPPAFEPIHVPPHHHAAKHA